MEKSRLRDKTPRNSTKNSPVIDEVLQKWMMSQSSVEKAERLMEEAGIPGLRVRGERLS